MRLHHHGRDGEFFGVREAKRDALHTHLVGAFAGVAVESYLWWSATFAGDLYRFPGDASDAGAQGLHHGLFCRESACQLGSAISGVSAFFGGEYLVEKSNWVPVANGGDARNFDEINAGVYHFSGTRAGPLVDAMVLNRALNRQPKASTGIGSTVHMINRIISGNEIAKKVHAEVAVKVNAFREAHAYSPGLAVVLVGDDPASRSYVRRKELACEEVGILTETIHIDADVSANHLAGVIGELNVDSRYHGILVQLPLPDHIDADEIVNGLDPLKDVDGLHSQNAGLLSLGQPRFVPATPLGVQRMLLETDVEVNGAEVVIVGRSTLVGRPLALLLSQRGRGANATVTMCHTGTRDVAAHTRRADILIAAAGVPNTVTADMVNEGAVVIDVGVSRVEDPSRRSGYRLTGDVDYQTVKEKASAITPVPGGVGPMTVAMLLENVVLAAKLQSE